MCTVTALHERMGFVSHVAVAIGILLACLGWVWGQNSGSNNREKTDTSALENQEQRRTPINVRRSDGDSNLLRAKAEAAVDKAAVLRQKQTAKGLKAAVFLLRESSGLFKAARLSSKAAEASLQLGEIYSTLSQFDKALSAYGDALRLATDDNELRCQALSRMARTYTTRGNSEKADSYSQQAIELSRGLSSRTKAAALVARGEALQYFNPSQAVDILTQALKLYQEIEDANGQADAVLLLAYIRFGISDPIEGFHLARQSLRLWSSTGNEYGVAQAFTALGFFAATTGEFETARCDYEKGALPIFETIGDQDNQAIALNGAAFASRERGDLETSLANYQRAKAIFISVQDDLGAAGAIAEIGKTLSMMKRYQQLRSLYREKLRLAEKTGNPAEAASALADLAGVYELENQSARAEVLYRRSLAAYNPAHRDYGAAEVMMRLAGIHTGRGEYSEAISLLESARPLKEKAHQMEDVARINYELAYIYRRLNRLEEARAAIEKTIEIIESDRLKIGNFDSRAVYFASVHKYYALYIQILMLLHQQDPQGGFMQLAFESSEKSKVRALIDLLSASSPGIPCAEVLRRQLADSTDTVAAESDSPASSAPVMTLQQIQAGIASDDSVLLEYALGDEKSYLWIVDHNQVIVHELPPAEKIGRLARAVNTAVTARQPRPDDKSLAEYHKRVDQADAAYQRYARQLSSKLLPQSLDLTRAKRLLIVPDGSLQSVPFAALPLSSAAEKNAILINRHEVVVLPSGSALNTLRNAVAKRPPPTSGAVIFADPVFERDDPRVHRADGLPAKKSQAKSSELKLALRDAGQSQHVERLPGSRAEARNIKESFHGQDVLVVQDFRATKETVVQGLLEHYRYIHLATHGLIDLQHPETSGLILSLISEGGKSQDGYLLLGDIYKLKLSADLVVLSACRSALGKDLESEGIIGLPRGFLYAGAKSVIASLWKVDDDATAKLMGILYARIQRDESPSSALRQAQLEMARGTKWHEPFYWAAFVLQGDYK